MNLSGLIFAAGCLLFLGSCAERERIDFRFRMDLGRALGQTQFVVLGDVMGLQRTWISGFFQGELLRFHRETVKFQVVAAYKGGLSGTVDAIDYIDVELKGKAGVGYVGNQPLPSRAPRKVGDRAVFLLRQSPSGYRMVFDENSASFPVRCRSKTEAHAVLLNWDCGTNPAERGFSQDFRWSAGIVRFLGGAGAAYAGIREGFETAPVAYQRAATEPLGIWGLCVKTSWVLDQRGLKQPAPADAKERQLSAYLLAKEPRTPEWETLVACHPAAEVRALAPSAKRDERKCMPCEH